MTPSRSDPGLTPASSTPRSNFAITVIVKIISHDEINTLVVLPFYVLLVSIAVVLDPSLLVNRSVLDQDNVTVVLYTLKTDSH